jgi:hypothetical protein
LKLTKKLASVGVTVLMAASWGLIAAPAAHAAAPPPLDPTHWTVACDSLTGSLKFATALSLGVATTNNTITVKAVTQGCTVPDSSVANGTAPGVNGGGETTGDPHTCVAPGVKHVTSGTPGITHNGDQNITAATGSFLASDVGQFITASTPVADIPANTLVTAVSNDGSGATLSQAAQANLLTVKFTLGLGTPNQPCVDLAPAKLGGTLVSLAGQNQTPPIPNSSGCLGLQGVSSGTSGDAVTVFKNQAKGLDNVTPLPKLLTAGSANLNANVTLGVGATDGTTFSGDGWGASYGEFEVGLVPGDGQVTPAVVRDNTHPAGSQGNAFQGTDSGAGDGFAGTTGESSAAILTMCLGKGVKALTFGIGMVNFG